MDEKLTIAVIEGSTRDKRESIKAAKFIADMGAKQANVEIIFVDPKDFSFPNDGNDTEGKDPRYTDIVARADGFFIIVPEYNHSFPGSLKRMLDSEYENYFHKPAVMAGVSNGGWGGVRAVEAMLHPLRTMGLVTVCEGVNFPRIQDIFDDNGVMHDEHLERYTRNAQNAWSELLWMARTLKWGRENA